MNAAVAYLESDEEYLEIGWERGLPLVLIDFRSTFDPDLLWDECNCHAYDFNDTYLCTGDGFRWSPAVPALRFT